MAINGANEERPKGVCSIRIVLRREATENNANAPHSRHSPGAKRPENAAVSGRPKGESVLTAWFPARAERGKAVRCSDWLGALGPEQ